MPLAYSFEHTIAEVSQLGKTYMRIWSATLRNGKRLQEQLRHCLPTWPNPIEGTGPKDPMRVRFKFESAPRAISAQ